MLPQPEQYLDTTQFPTASTLCCWRVFLSNPLFPPNQGCTSIAATTVSSRRASAIDPSSFPRLAALIPSPKKSLPCENIYKFQTSQISTHLEGAHFQLPFLHSKRTRTCWVQTLHWNLWFSDMCSYPLSRSQNRCPFFLAKMASHGWALTVCTNMVPAIGYITAAWRW